MTAPPLLVGRDRELAGLRERLATALAGQGSLVLIGGVAGIGKTALAEALLGEVAGGALVLIGRCYDLSDTPPYGPWREALAQLPAGADAALLPRLLVASDQPGVSLASQEAVFTGLRAFLAAEAATRPVVLLLDDLHWADPASLDLLRMLARAIATLPVLLLVTYRSDELSRQHRLYQFLPLLVREAGAAQLDLRPLTDGDLRALVRARYGLAAWEEGRLLTHLHERAQGNPLFAGEILRTLEETGALQRTADGWALGPLAGVQLPPLLRQVIEGRLARLGVEAERHLALAAVIGQETPIDLWATAAMVDNEALLATIEQATRAHILVANASGGGVRFVHALVREALYEGVLPSRRVAWHRRVAEALLGEANPDPDAVAYHLRQAADPRAAEWLIRAGERAQRAYAWISAAERYEAALALPEGAAGDPRQRALLLMSMAQLRRYMNPAQGIAYLEEAERLALEASDQVLAAAASFDRGQLRQMAREDYSRGLDEMRAALPILEAAPEVQLRQLPTLTILSVMPGDPHHRGVLFRWLTQTGHLAEARLQLAALAERTTAPSARRLAGQGELFALLGQPAAAQRALADGAGIFRAVGQHFEAALIAVHALSCLVHYQAEDQVERLRLVDEIGEGYRRAGGVNAVPFAIWQRSVVLFVEGAWAELRQAASILREREGIIIDIGIGMMARAQGDRELARAEVHRHLPRGHATAPGTGDFRRQQEHQRLAALLSLDEGELATARAWLEAHDRWLAWSGAVFGQSEGQLAWAEYYRAVGEPARAIEHAERALAYATEPRQPLALLNADRSLGELATNARRYDDAAAHLNAALALAEACAAPYERALTLIAMAELRAAQGERDGARVLLGEASAILTPLEAHPALARVEALSVRLAAPTPSPGAYPAGLSAREVEVLRLIAQGLTNPQVAERLFLSRRTVDQHLRSIYGKVGVSTRTAAARFAIEHGLT